MKKTLLLSIVAASAVMAGGNVAAPVAPVVAASAWDFSGNAVVYYQTNDTVTLGAQTATNDLFDQNAASADAGVQFRATNANLFNGIGAGIELSGLATLGLEDDMVSGVMQQPMNGAWFSQGYITMDVAGTTVKAGRQELPQSLSPMAYSDNWNVFANTFDAVVAVNGSLLPNSTVVAAYVHAANSNAMASDMSVFNNVGAEGAYMLTIQNKSIENVTLTGSAYLLPAFDGDATIYWGDVQTSVAGMNVGLQSYKADSDTQDAVLYGAKIGKEISGINFGAAYSTLDSKKDKWTNHAIGTTTSSVYTNTAFDQVHPESANEDKYTVSASTAVLGGTATVVYADAQYELANKDYTEFDVVYSTEALGLPVTAAYVNVDYDGTADNIQLVRVVASYKF